MKAIRTDKVNDYSQMENEAQPENNLSYQIHDNNVSQVSMKASDLFIRCLESEGVEYIFGLPGEETNDLMMSIVNSKIKFILVRHEQGAAFMADMYGNKSNNRGCKCEHGQISNIGYYRPNRFKSIA